MKTVATIAVLFMLCIFCCCGVGFLLPSRSIEGPPRVGNQPQVQSTGHPQVAKSPTSEADRILAQRMQKYEQESLAWENSRKAAETKKDELDSQYKRFAVTEIDVALPPVFHSREWTSADQKFKTEGTLVYSSDTNATLKKANGKLITISKNVLTAEDQRYLEQAFHDQSEYLETVRVREAQRSKLLDELVAAGAQVSSLEASKPKMPTRQEIVDELAAADAERMAAERAFAIETAEMRRKDQARWAPEMTPRSPPPATPAPQRTLGSAVYAWSITKQFVEEKLVSPGSAKWPWWSEKFVTHMGGGKYRVTAYVDSQNSFGALLRTKFVAVVETKDGTNWSLLSLDVE